MKKTLTIFLVSASLFLAAAPALAQVQTTNQPFCQGGKCTYIPLEPLPISGYSNCYGAANQACTSPVPFEALVSRGFELLLASGAAIAVIMLVIGALTYMFSDVVGNKTKALDRIRGAMWGIVILVSSFLILRTINPELVKFQINTSAITGPQAPTTGTPATITVQQPNSTIIYNGQSAYDDLMKMQALCQSPKSMHATSDGSDAKGGYVVWTCQ